MVLSKANYTFEIKNQNKEKGGHKMKNYKKILAASLAAAMLVASFTACSAPESEGTNSTGGGGTTSTSGGNGGGDDGGDEMMEFDVSIAIWDVEKGMANGADDPILQKLKEETGITFSPLNVTWDDYDQKLKLWASSGQLPDMFASGYVGSSVYFDWIDQNVIRSVPSDLSAYPTLEAYMQGTRAQSSKVDGEFYMIPRQTYPDLYYSVLDRNVAYRWDLAQAAGITEEPKTMDEFREMLLAIIDADPESSGISGITATFPDALIGGIIFPWAEIAPGKWVHTGEEFMPSYFAGYENGTLLQAMQLGRDMYEEGTIENDFALTTTVTGPEKFLQGQNAAYIYAGGMGSLYNGIARDWAEVYPDKDFHESVKILDIMPSIDGIKRYFVDTESWSETYFSSNVDDEKMNALLKLFDFLHTDEGKYLMFAGFEGVDYDLDENGAAVLREGIVLADKYPTMDSSFSSLAVWNPNNVNPNFPTNTPMEFYDMNNARYEEAKNEGEMFEFYQEVSFLYTPLKSDFVYSHTDDFLAVMAGSEPVETMLDDLMAGYEADGLSDMIAEVNQYAADAGITP